VTTPGQPLVVLVGPMGAGKSTVAALLAARFGVEARDTDTDVEATEGRTISDIFVDSGEAHFRALERAAVAAALSTHSGVVFLRVGLAEAVKRVGLGAGRPMLFGNVRARIKATLEERAPIYESVATIVVDTDETSPDEVAARVQEALA
jgi:shikimate kinase